MRPPSPTLFPYTTLFRSEPFDLPRIECEDRAAEAARVGDLAKRAPSTSNRDHALRRGDDQEVAALAKAGRQRDREIRVRILAIALGQESHDCAAFARGALAGRARDAAVAAVDDDRAGPREQPPHLARRVELRWCRVARTTHSDIPTRHRVRSLFGTISCEVQRPLGKGGEAELWIYPVVVPAASFASRELGRRAASSL